MRKRWSLFLPIFLLSGCIFTPKLAPTADLGVLATQIWMQISVEQTLAAAQVTATTQYTSTPEPTPSPLWFSTPLPQPADINNYTPVFNQVSGMEVVYVGAGEFLMGSSTGDSNRDANEEPQHKVFLDAFWISKTQVTNAMFNACVAAGACQYSVSHATNPNYHDPLFTNHPVVYVSWEAAQDYCAWTGGRLPTEAEWEKAARGPNGQRFPWGEEMARIKFANAGDEIGNTTPVGSFPYGKSYYGALDMGSNVREWVLDWYDANYYQYSPSVNPQGPAGGEKKVLKGASFQDEWRYCRSANRLAHEPQSPGSTRGFRCVYP